MSGARSKRRDQKNPRIKDKEKSKGTPVGALGTPGLEKADVVKRRQADMLERLKSNGWFRHLRGPIQRFTANRCGNNRCVEVCAFGDWRRRLQQIPAAYRLIRQASDPVYEVRIVRGIWARPIGDLRTASIAALYVPVANVVLIADSSFVHLNECLLASSGHIFR
jgi:hypothetical protein